MTATQRSIKRNIGWFLGLFILLTVSFPARGGDSMYGTVTEVRSADVITFDYGEGKYQVRIIGIEVPRAGTLARRAKQFVTNLVLNKKVRLRFDHRTPNGEMVCRVFTDEPNTGIKEVGVELLKAGFARRQRGYDYKYGELSAAENDAKKARRGIWAQGK